MRSIPLVLTVVAFATAVPAQAFQSTLQSNFDQHGPYNCVWGYVAPNGKEYALLGATTGTVVVDCTIPTAPVERGWFPWMNSTWREIRTYGTYAYVVTEAAGGFQVIDLTNADAPVSLGIVGASQFGNCHNIGVDHGTGRIYCVGCNTGSPVFDASLTPHAPTFVGYAGGSGNSNYFHDLHVENGYGWGGMIYNGLLRILDVSSFPPPALSNSQTPSAFTHNAWPNAAATLCVTTDERAGSVVRVYDTTNKSAPVALSQIGISFSVPHNAYIKGEYAHVAWYTEGYQCIDLKDPSNPIIVSSYDTWPGAMGGFNGAWGCFPFLPSGNVYISDRSTGLYVIKPHLTDLAIAHTPLVSTTSEVGPYTVNANVTSSHAISSATLRYRIGGGAFQSVPMTLAAPGQYTGNIPGQNAIADVEYHIDVVDTQAARRSPRIGEHRFLVGTHVSRWLDTFETALAWTNGGTGNEWQHGVCTGRTGASNNVAWTDPVRAYSGSQVRGTDLGFGGANFVGTHASNADCWLQSPAIPTAGVQGLRLSFQRWLTVQAGDVARLLVNGNVVWTSSGALADTQWTRVEHDISAIANTAANLTVRFELTSDAANVAGGWTLDDVEIFTRHDAAPAIVYGTGTPGTGGIVPQLALPAPALLGTTTNLQGSAMLANSVAVLALNLAPANVAALGITLLVDPVGADLQAVVISGTGTAAWPFVVPTTPALDNIWLYAQAAPLDPAGPAGLLAASAGLRFRTCLSAP